MKVLIVVLILSLLVVPASAIQEVSYTSGEAIVVTDHNFNVLSTRNISSSTPASYDGSSVGPDYYPLNVDNHSVYYENLLDKTVASYNLQNGTIKPLASLTNFSRLDRGYNYVDLGRVTVDVNDQRTSGSWNHSLLSQSLFSSVIKHYDGSLVVDNYTVQDVLSSSLVDYMDQISDLQVDIGANYVLSHLFGHHLWVDVSLNLYSASNSSVRGGDIWLNIDLNSGTLNPYFLSSSSFKDAINCDIGAGANNIVYNDILQSFMVYSQYQYCIINETNRNLDKGTLLNFKTQITYFNTTDYIQSAFDDFVVTPFSGAASVNVSSLVGVQNMVAMVSSGHDFVFLVVGITSELRGVSNPIFGLGNLELILLILVVLTIFLVQVRRRIHQ